MNRFTGHHMANIILYTAKMYNACYVSRHVSDIYYYEIIKILKPKLNVEPFWLTSILMQFCEMYFWTYPVWDQYCTGPISVREALSLQHS